MPIFWLRSIFLLHLLFFRFYKIIFFVYCSILVLYIPFICFDNILKTCWCIKDIPYISTMLVFCQIYYTQSAHYHWMLSPILKINIYIAWKRLGLLLIKIATCFRLDFRIELLQSWRTTHSWKSGFYHLCKRWLTSVSIMLLWFSE